MRDPAVEVAVAAVDPVDVHRDRDRRLVVLDVVPPVLAAPLVGSVRVRRRLGCSAAVCKQMRVGDPPEDPAKRAQPWTVTPALVAAPALDGRPCLRRTGRSPRTTGEPQRREQLSARFRGYCAERRLWSAALDPAALLGLEAALRVVRVACRVDGENCLRSHAVAIWAAQRVPARASFGA